MRFSLGDSGFSYRLCSVQLRGAAGKGGECCKGREERKKEREKEVSSSLSLGKSILLSANTGKRYFLSFSVLHYTV